MNPNHRPMLFILLTGCLLQGCLSALVIAYLLFRPLPAGTCSTDAECACLDAERTADPDVEVIDLSKI